MNNGKILLTVGMLLLSRFLFAQWEAGIGAGVAIPITGYSEVVKSGWLLSAEGKYRFGKGNFAVGATGHFTRLQHDKDPADALQNVRITIAPFLFNAEYGFSKGRLQPYASAGLGITFYNINYDVSPTSGETIFNVSFTMMPLVGVRYAATKNIYPFIESGFIFIADGPPVGFPKADKLTGYNSISAGIHYRFK
jgi:hypothetical protein